LLAALLVSMAPAARKSQPASGASAQSDNAPPMVDELYTFGAPGVSSPGLKNPRRGDGCFAGLRAWTWSRAGFPASGYRIDAVVPLAGLFGYRHAWMRGAELDVTNKTVRFQDCSEAMTNSPTGSTAIGLHYPEQYRDAVRVLGDERATNMTILGTAFSYNRNPQEEVAAGVREYGWRLVGTGFDDGSDAITGGAQVSHLFQHPGSLECILTFQGSDSLLDWFGNIDVYQVSFCGLSERVHKGFRDHLRRIIRNPTWQQNVRSHLGRCRKVFATGHSLGGVRAELFTACTANAPSSGRGYDEDYSFIGWQKKAPARLPYL